MEYLSLLPATALGYFTFKATTHPNAKIRQRMPDIKIRRLQVFPVIKFDIRGKNIHFHHWMNFSILLAISGVTSFAVLDHILTRGLLIGGIIQGLTLPSGHMNVFSCKCSHCIN